VNRLADASSPYLLQHADNPVDWRPWGEEAFAEARERDVAVLVSIGYSACHWCHVMAHESFEDADTAALMNRLFVCVKVDREERPDVDAIYMDAVVAQTGHGGWPMTVFVAPDGRPFWGGTYFPPTPRHGIPSFRQVLDGVADAYRNRREDVVAQSAQLTAQIGGIVAGARATGELSWATVDAALGGLRNAFDPAHAGFGGAPKFPPSALLPTLLALGERGAAAEMALATLDAMADGGIHDQLGGGFHRYTVDGIWLVPHFEKMLYDNALLARAYVHGHALTGEQRLADVARSTLDYLDREMALPGGGLASAQDADTQGVEGSTFVWTPAEVEAVVGPAAAAVVCARFGIATPGNFEGSNVLSIVEDASESDHDLLAEARARLLAARDLRPQPFRDDKAVTAWNGMALAAYADAGRVLGDGALVARAREIAGFLLGPLSRVDGRLLRTWRLGEARIDAFSEDYGAVADGLIALHRATGELVWLDQARRLTALALELFDEDGAGAFLQAPLDGERLAARRRDADDNPTPSGSSLIAGCLVRLGRVYDDRGWEERGAEAVRAMGRMVERAPSAFGHLLGTLHLLLETPREVAIVGHADDPRTYALRAAVDAVFDPALVVVVADPRDPLAATVPILSGRGLVDGRPAAYVCERMVCARPVTDRAALVALLAPPVAP
jgi:uncharacterized protein YyaL (SSP411 family)